MPAIPGVIITVSILIAAGLAAYESPEVRRWVENSRRKIAFALHSLGDEISPKVKENKKHDPSMDEEKTSEAEERRRQARAEIIERGRVMEEQRRKRKEGRVSGKRDSGVGSFDSLVDEDGNLKKDLATQDDVVKATSIEPGSSSPAGLTKRNIQRHESESLRELGKPSQSSDTGLPPSYEQELRQNWDLPLPPITTAASQTSHASESILDLTPTSEFPDPEISVPALSASPQALQHGEYFTISHPSDTASRTLSSPSPSQSAASASSSYYYYAHPNAPNVPISHPAPATRSQTQHLPLSSAASTADTSDLEHIRGSDLGSELGLPSNNSGVGPFSDEDEEEADGVKTPEGSLWTDVGSEVSGDQ
ncbi:hypothetical protein UCRPC4_g03733 [Phaeomoniella chlamydospora]|uniref:Uncharacterized protein n=1 Tax=Phaeomoniella chlamydospora TaxID=158046 RepID=A0A0G2GXU6_PHACM|nr:hypothetical protein UCRPC4_g03733 [Phaeomoniella chlamydospora]